MCAFVCLFVCICMCVCACVRSCAYVRVSVCDCVLRFYLRRLPTSRALVDTPSLVVCFVILLSVKSPATVHQRKTQVARTYKGRPPVVLHERYPFHLVREPAEALLFVVDILSSCRYFEYVSTKFACEQIGR